MTRPIITFPDIGIDDFEFYPEQSHDRATSPFTGRSQIKLKDGTRWMASLRFNKLSRAEASLMQAFIWDCDGPVGTFYLPDYLYEQKTEPATHPKVAAASQTGKTLATKDWPVSTQVLSAGDYIEVAGQMRGVVNDVVSNGSGLATINLSHRFYSTPGLNNSVNYWNPKALFSLPDNRQGRRRTNSVMRSNFRLQVEEVII